MKSPVTIIVICLIICFSSCNWFDYNETRKVTCVSPGDYEYLEHDYIDSICTTEICSIYADIWKKLFIKKNNMTEDYFDKHFTIINSRTSPQETRFYISYRIQNDWAIAVWGDAFIIKIAVDNNRYPDIGLPKGTFLTLEEIEAAIDNGGFTSKISNVPKTGPLRYSSMNEAIDSLIKAAPVDTICFNRVFLNLPTGTLTLEAFAAYEDEENSCIKGTIDLITGSTYIVNISCDKIYSP